MEKALRELDRSLSAEGHSGVKLLIGGGAAFSLAYGIPIQTADIDGILFKSKIDPADLDVLVKKAGKTLDIAPDWLNPYFGTFLISLPSDYGDRLKSVFRGKALEVFALGLTDLLIMKCFAGREKDMLHAKLLLRKGADIQKAESHLETLIEKNIPDAQEALDFLLEVEEQVGE
jgi:hypothetical protein